MCLTGIVNAYIGSPTESGSLSVSILFPYPAGARHEVNLLVNLPRCQAIQKLDRVLDIVWTV